MRIILLCCALGIGLTGCRLPPDREPFKPLQTGAQFSYGELLSRLRGQANAAMDAFFVDAWIELEEAGVGIDETARFLAKTNDPPEHLKTNLVQSCGNLQKEAIRLADAARKKNADAATEALQRISLQIRQLRGAREER
jgi:hypothetical protein